MNTILNLDDYSTWHAEFHELVYSPKTWSLISQTLNQRERGAVDFYSQLTCRSEYLHDPLAIRLRAEALNILLSRYTSVAACHGCRIVDRLSYQTRGISVSDTAELTHIAKVLFQGIPGFDEAVRDLGRMYYEHNDGKVGLLMSFKWAEHTANEYCKGSELISGLAQRLGEEAVRRFDNYGKPTFIKCHVPISWLDEHTTFPVRHDYAHTILAELVRQRHDPHSAWRGAEGGYILKRSIPPVNILGFEDMSEAMG